MSNKGATVTSVETLSTLLRQEGYEVIVASSKINKAIRIMDMIGHVIRFGRQSGYVLIDTYSTSNFWYAVIVAWCCRFYDLPYIPILRGGNLPHRLATNPNTSKKLFNNASLNLAPSYYLIDAFNKKGISNIKYIPNTVFLDNYAFIKRESLSPNLLWVRSFSEIYNPLMALKVLHKLQEEFPEATLTMVGPEKDRSYEECRAFAKAQNLAVTFTGLLSKEAWIALAASHDIFINTTNFDNTPVSVIEAMALGLPVVSTNVGGMSFLIDDGKDGLLSPPKDVQAFVDSISRLLNDTGLARQLAQNARKKAEGFDWTTVKSLWEEVLS